MPKLHLTKRNIDKIIPPEKGQVDYFDTEVKGFALRVACDYNDKKTGEMVRGAKTFFVQVDVKDPNKPKGYRTVKKTLGRYRDLTPEQARKLVNGHHDEQGGFVAGKRLELKSGPISDNGANVTLRQMLSYYFLEKKRRDGKPFKQATVDGYTRIIERHFENWLPLTLPDVAKLTPETVIELYRQIESNHGSYGARNGFVMLMAIINYALIRHPGAIATNPLNVLRLGKHMKKIEARTDKLTGNDFKVFNEGIRKFNKITQDAYLFCLYQGLRSEETAGLQWEYMENGKRQGGIDLEKKEMFIPDTKNRQPLHVPLSRQSLAILKQRKEQNPEGNPFVFPSLPRPQCLNKTGHVRLVSAELRAKTGLSITIHGLRRSFITTARRLKIFEDADRLTNHVDASISGKHYDGTDVDDLRQPLQVIANEIERLMMEGVGAKVIQLPNASSQA
jgi:integrase